MRKDKIFDWEHNRSPGTSCTVFWVSWLSREKRVRGKTYDKGNSYQLGRNMQQPAGCCYFMFWLDSSSKRGNRFEWKPLWAYGAALSDSLLWHLTARRDQRLLSNKALWPWDLAPTPGILLAEVCTTCASCRSKPIPRRHLQRLIPSIVFPSVFPPPRVCTVYWTHHPLFAVHISRVNSGCF